MIALLCPLGSAGDVYPLLGIGRVLADRGHEPVVLTNGHFRPVVEALGWRLVETGTDDEYRRLTRDPDLWHPTRSPKLIMGMIGRGAELTVDALAEFAGADAVTVAGTPSLGPRLVQEAGGLRCVSVHLQPTVLRSLHENPLLPVPVLPRWAPRWWKRLVWRGADAAVDRMLHPYLRPLRRRLGLPPVSRYAKGWWHSPRRVLGMWPEWFGAVQPDWPRQTRLCGFPLWDDADTRPLPADLERFLDEGEPPLLFTAGSAMHEAAEYFAAAVAAGRALGRRALLVVRRPESLPPLQEGERHVPYAPFSVLFPRCAAVVHHGGVGTCARGLAAGVPQLVVPMAHDQPDNADRLRRLGVAEVLPSGRFTATRAAAALDRLLKDESVAAACDRWRSHVRSDGCAIAADWIEEVR